MSPQGSKNEFWRTKAAITPTRPVELLIVQLAYQIYPNNILLPKHLSPSEHFSPRYLLPPTQIPYGTLHSWPRLTLEQGDRDRGPPKRYVLYK